MFKINFTKLVQWLLPSFLRSANLTILILSANYPLREVYDSFVRYRNDVQYRLSHNSQVCYLQAMLNDYFDASLRRIRVVDFTAYGNLYLFAQEDNLDVNIGEERNPPCYLFPDDVGVDFTVQLPHPTLRHVIIPSQVAYIKSMIDEYKLPGKVYSLEWV